MRANRTDQMQELRYKHKWTIEKIGKFFNISRERVRQLIGNTGRITQRDKASRMLDLYESNKGLSNAQLGRLLGIKSVSKYRNGERHNIDGSGYPKIGADTEELVSERLSYLGIGHKLMPYAHPFDILLDTGSRVDVKSAEPISLRFYLFPCYTFHTKVIEKGHYCDFFILVLRDLTDFFVVPFKDAKDCIRFSYPQYGYPSKWLKYHNRFDFLK